MEPLDFEINPTLLTEGFTQSEMQSWDNCPEMWYLRYNLMLEKKGQLNWGAVYGSWIHSSLEEWYRTKGKRWTWDPTFKKDPTMKQDALAEYDFWAQFGKRQMEIYTSHYKHDPEIIKPYDVETKVDIRYEGFRLKGMIDLPCRHKLLKENLVMDHKTTNRLDKSVMMGWDFRFQFLFYIFLAKRHPEFEGIKWGGFMPNGIKKSQLRRGVNESLPAFINRIQLDMQARPEAYFYRDPMLLKKGDMAHFEEHILKPKLARLRILLDPKTPKHVRIAILRNKNTDYCVKYGAKYPCQFLPLCQKGMLNKGLYRRRSVKHTELAEDDTSE